ncbi:MAG: hypothetical protein CMM75_11565 [Rhodospirillaceae bacterium]|nr:hypothetical protein [Rhodospirillaceae bacterium]
MTLIAVAILAIFSTPEHPQTSQRTHRTLCQENVMTIWPTCQKHPSVNVYMKQIGIDQPQRQIFFNKLKNIG